MSKPVIGLFTSVEGHLSIAEAIEEALSDEFEIQLYLERNDFFDLYVPIYKFFPSLLGMPFRFVRQKRISALLNHYFQHKYQRKLRSFYRKYEPKMLISTYFMYNPALERISDLHHIPFINVLTDPRTFHPMIVAERAEVNLTFDDFSQKACLKYFPDAQIQKMGWLVRSSYEQTYDKNKVREKLGLRPDVLTILVVSGSEGTNVVTTILPSLLNTQKPIQVLVACGNSKALYQTVKQVGQHIPGIKGETRLEPIGFTKELYLYMQAADLVVGKAGPNTLFEAVATLTPFFATTHIAGQEDGNLDIIRQHHLGYVEENIFKANTLLRKIIRNPEQLANFQPHLKKMAAYNASAKKELKTLAHQLLKNGKI